MAQLVDLSQEIYDGMPVYAGHLETKVWHHGPTHVDALSHLDPREDAPSIDQMPLETFCGGGTCLDVSDVAPREYITGERLDRALAESPADLNRGDVLL